VADVSLSFPPPVPPFPGFSFAGTVLRALPCGALFWPDEGLLLVADLHLEKGSAFARRGWLLPPHDSLETLGRLVSAVERTGARAVVALGDSFHDSLGAATMPAEARALLGRVTALAEMIWVTGNHDGASAEALGGRVVDELQVCGIRLRHEAVPGCTEPEISGHYHPKVRLPLRTGRQVSRPCLALAGARLVLPAYGAYAGGLSVDDQAFVAALGEAPEAIVPVAGGLIRLTAKQRMQVR
jgi:DNA ligase-associated metallophosphoesterase